jgi:AcrR family transcriptional regulator
MMSDTETRARSYISPLRAEAAQATRLRIIQAAADLFTERGYSGTTMPAIAKGAGVSVQSVHLAGPKSSLLMAAFELSFAGDEGSHSLMARPHMGHIFQLEPTAAFDEYCRLISEANAKAYGVYHALHAAAEVDEQVAAMVADLDRRRHQELLGGLRWIEQHGMLGGIGTLDQRAEVWAYLSSPDAYRYYVKLRGWSHELYVVWLRRSIEQLVLGTEIGTASAEFLAAGKAIQ